MEIRGGPRVNVTWRGLMKTGSNTLVPIRVLNVSPNGFMIQSAQSLIINREYQLMVEIPNIDQVTPIPYKVPCRVVVTYAVLSGDYFRVGVQFTEISELHLDLVAAWVSLASKFNPS